MEAFFAASEIFLGGGAGGDVHGDDETGLAAGVDDAVGENLDRDKIAVFFAVGPYTGGGVRAGEAGEVGGEGGEFAWRADIADRQAEELGLRVSIDPYGGFVDVEKGERLGIVDPDGQRIAVEEDALTFLA